MGGREEAYCLRRIATRNLADAARTTVHNSLPDCRGFKTRGVTRDGSDQYFELTRSEIVGVQRNKLQQK